MTMNLLLVAGTLINCWYFWTVVAINPMEEDDVNPINSSKHNRLSPPLGAKGESVAVYVDLDILHVGGIDQKTQQFKLQFYLSEQWSDPRLLASGYKIGHRINEDDSNIIWQPLICFDKAQVVQIFTQNRQLTINTESYVQRVTRLDFSALCSMRMVLYPLDTQLCTFTIGNLVENDQIVELHWVKGIRPQRENVNNEIETTSDVSFRVQVTNTSRETKNKDLGPFSTLVVTLKFERLFTSSVLKTYIPSSLLVILSWASFWLDVESVPARVSLGITSVLTIVTQITQAVHMSYLNALDIWLFACEILVIATIIEYVIAYQTAIGAFEKHLQEEPNGLQIEGYPIGADGFPIEPDGFPIGPDEFPVRQDLIPPQAEQQPEALFAEHAPNSPSLVRTKQISQHTSLLQLSTEQGRSGQQLKTRKRRLKNIAKQFDDTNPFTGSSKKLSSRLSYISQVKRSKRSAANNLTSGVRIPDVPESRASQTPAVVSPCQSQLLQEQMKREQEAQEALEAVNEQAKKRVDRFSRKLFPIVFATFATIYWATLLTLARQLT